MRLAYGRVRGPRVAQGPPSLTSETVEIGVGQARLEQRHKVCPTTEQGTR